MDLKIKDVARLLQVSEQTVRRWVDEETIPYYELNGIPQFDRVEIEAWMVQSAMPSADSVANTVASEEEMHDHTGRQQFNLYRAINRGGVCRDVPGTTKEEVIRNAMKAVAQKFELDAEVISELLLDREKLMSTSLGEGIAVPHTRDFLLSSGYDLVTVVFPAHPLPYEALDNQPVHTLFFLFACNDQRHLNLLAKIAHFAVQPKMREFLATRPEKESLLQMVKEWEGTLKAG